MQATGGSKCQHALCFLTKISSTARVSLRVLIFLISLFLSGGISTLSLVKFKNKLTLLRVYYKKFAAVHFCTHAESPTVPDPIFFWELHGYIKLQAQVPSIQRLSHLSHCITCASSSLFCGWLLPSTHTGWQWSGFDVPSVVYRCSRKKTKQWVCLYRLPDYCIKGQKCLFSITV